MQRRGKCCRYNLSPMADKEPIRPEGQVFIGPDIGFMCEFRKKF